MKKQALLIIDIQKDFTSANAQMPVDQEQANQMITNLNTLLARLDRANTEVVYIGNEYSKWDPLNIFRNFAAVEGTDGAKLDERLHVVNNIYFSKNRGDAFSNPKLDEFLKQQKITELFLCGLMADACVYSTVKGAINRHYKTIVLTDCIAAKTKMKCAKMMGKYKKAGAGLLRSVDV